MATPTSLKRMSASSWMLSAETSNTLCAGKSLLSPCHAGQDHELACRFLSLLMWGHPARRLQRHMLYQG